MFLNSVINYLNKLKENIGTYRQSIFLILSKRNGIKQISTKNNESFMANKKIKIRHIYTVVREYNVPAKDLKQSIDDCNHIKDDVEEYLFGGSPGKETITFQMEYEKDGKTVKIQ